MKIYIRLLCVCLSIAMFLGSIQAEGLLTNGLTDSSKIPAAIFMRDYFWFIEIGCLIIAAPLVRVKMKLGFIVWCCTQAVLWQLAVGSICVQRAYRDMDIAIDGTSVRAQISNPVNHFELLGSGIQPVMKWEADINGDGRNEVFLSLKEEYHRDIDSDQPPGWFVYIAAAADAIYNKSIGIKDQGDDSIGAVVPMIDLKTCFVGEVSELGQHAIVTMQIDSPRAGADGSIARIFAYTIEGDHLKRTKLAEYNPEDPNALFDKYLMDGKRTLIAPIEVNP